MLTLGRELETAVRPLLLIAFALLTLAARPAAADSFTPSQRDEIVRIVRDALKSDPSILREALTGLQADEAHRQDTATSDVLGTLGGKLVDPADPVAGNPAAPVTIVEFYDPRCPYCKSMMPTLAALLHDDPNVRLVYKDWPILGPVSQLESRALLAAQRQGGYFKLQAALMQGSRSAEPRLDPRDGRPARPRRRAAAARHGRPGDQAAAGRHHGAGAADRPARHAGADHRPQADRRRGRAAANSGRPSPMRAARNSVLR